MKGLFIFFCGSFISLVIFGGLILFSPIAAGLCHVGLLRLDEIASDPVAGQAIQVPDQSTQPVQAYTPQPSTDTVTSREAHAEQALADATQQVASLRQQLSATNTTLKSFEEANNQWAKSANAQRPQCQSTTAAPQVEESAGACAGVRGGGSYVHVGSTSVYLGQPRDQSDRAYSYDYSRTEVVTSGNVTVIDETEDGQ